MQLILQLKVGRRDQIQTVLCSNNVQQKDPSICIRENIDAHFWGEDIEITPGYCFTTQICLKLLLARVGCNGKVTGKPHSFPDDSLLFIPIYTDIYLSILKYFLFASLMELMMIHLLLVLYIYLYINRGRHTLCFSETGNFGPGSDMSKRITWMKKLSAHEINQLTDVNTFINQDGWLGKQPRI